jgi:hypothetical protein
MLHNSRQPPARWAAKASSASASSLPACASRSIAASNCPGVEHLELRAKPRQLARRQLFDGFFDVLGCHAAL